MINKYVLILWMSIILATVYQLFLVKYKVQFLEDHMKEINRQINIEKKAINLLNAEWSYLNNPVSIKKLSTKYLQIEAIKVSQIATNDLQSSYSFLKTMNDMYKKHNKKDDE